MRRWLWIVASGVAALISLGSAEAATYYVDNTSGSDSNSGTSSGSPWKTLTKVNNTAFSAGDVINFKRGSTWTGTTLVIDSIGNASTPVTYQAYGTGAAPIIQRSSTPPTSGFTESITVTGDYNVVKDLLVRHAHEACIHIASGATNNIIQDNEITACGLGVFLSASFNRVIGNYVHDLRMVVNTSGGDDDYGAVCFWVSAPDNEIAYNRGVNCKATSQDYGTDGGFVEVWNQGDRTSVHHNWAEGTDGFIELGSGNGGTANNVTVAYNVLLNTGVAVCPHTGGNFAITITNLRFEQNTVYQASGGRLLAGCSSNGFGFVSLRNNIIRMTQMGGTPGTHTHNLYAFTPSYSLGTGEQVGDPQFMNAGSKDFHLQDDSPAIDAAPDLGHDEDYDGNAVPQGASPDQGAFEYGDESPPAVTSVNDTAFTYTGTWDYATGAGKYLNDDHYTAVANRFYTYTFSGTKAQVFVAKAPWHGKVAVSIDGGAETTVDLYATSKADQVLIYTSPTLAAGTHTVKVRATGTKHASSTGTYVTADRIDVTP
jgi:hypothetical protein